MLNKQCKHAPFLCPHEAKKSFSKHFNDEIPTCKYSELVTYNNICEFTTAVYTALIQAKMFKEINCDCGYCNHPFFIIFNYDNNHNWHIQCKRMFTIANKENKRIANKIEATEIAAAVDLLLHIMCKQSEEFYPEKRFLLGVAYMAKYLFNLTETRRNGAEIVNTLLSHSGQNYS